MLMAALAAEVTDYYVERHRDEHSGLSDTTRSIAAATSSPRPNLARISEALERTFCR
jgi:hypothetical protein